jgi:hypothetical protein
MTFRFYTFSNGHEDSTHRALTQVSACKMTHRAISNDDFASETFEIPFSPITIGPLGLSQPAK